MNIIPLNKLPINCDGNIESLNCDGAIKRRFLDLGLIHGTKITPVFNSPSGDPTAFSIRGATIAIREEDAKKINIKEY